MLGEEAQNDVAEHEKYLTFGSLWLPSIYYPGIGASIMYVDSIG